MRNLIDEPLLPKENLSMSLGTLVLYVNIIQMMYVATSSMGKELLSNQSCSILNFSLGRSFFVLLLAYIDFCRQPKAVLFPPN
jgi:hypothetical protein